MEELGHIQQGSVKEDLGFELRFGDLGERSRK
jgi:hypothetical protein